jgi:hypothetical protein
VTHKEVPGNGHLFVFEAGFNEATPFVTGAIFWHAGRVICVFHARIVVASDGNRGHSRVAGERLRPIRHGVTLAL